MTNMSVELREHAADTLAKLEDPGLLLVGMKRRGRCNIMTIGWGFIGTFWSEPVFVVAVRHSRYTHEFIEESNEFTVNVPGKGLDRTVAYCGEVSGRDHDKAKERKLILQRGKKIRTPVVKKCKIHYECKVIHKLELDSRLIPANAKTFYRRKDYHTLYFGKILDVY